MIVMNSIASDRSLVSSQIPKYVLLAIHRQMKYRNCQITIVNKLDVETGPILPKNNAHATTYNAFHFITSTPTHYSSPPPPNSSPHPSTPSPRPLNPSPHPLNSFPHPLNSTP